MRKEEGGSLILQEKFHLLLQYFKLMDRTIRDISEQKIYRILPAINNEFCSLFTDVYGDTRDIDKT